MTDTAAASPPERGLFAHRDWRRMWIAQTISVVGDFVFDTTVVLWVGTVLAKGHSWAPAAVSGVLLAAALPIFLVGPIAGVFVDRLDRRRLMLAADALRAVVIALLLIVPAVGGLPVGVRLAMVYLAVAVCSAASQFFNPSRMAVVGSVVPKQHRQRAFSLAQASGSAAGIVGPPLAAPLLFGVGVDCALALNALSFAVSFFLLRSIAFTSPERDKDKAPSTLLADFREGISFFVHSRVLMALLGSVTVYTLGVGALNVLDVFFVTRNLHVAASWLGTLGAAIAVGSLLGALAIGAVSGRWADSRIYWLCLVVTGVGVLVYSRITWLPAAVVVIALIGLPVGAVNVVVGPLVLGVTPEKLLGRVVTVLGPVQQLASIMTMALAGFLASTVLRGEDVHLAGMRFGPIDTIFGVGGLLMIGGGLWASRLLRTPAPAPAAAPEPVAPEPEPEPEQQGVAG